jgi:hypothetical protein
MASCEICVSSAILSATIKINQTRGPVAAPVSYARSKAWQANARQVGRRWRSYAGLLAVAAAVIAVLAIAPDIPLRQGVIGVVIGAVVMMVAIATAGFDDPVMRGDMAEQWTAEAFAKQHWKIINNLIFTDGDLDHLVIAPCGVLAVETKYRYRQSDPRRLVQQRRRDLEAAQRAGRKTRSLLRSHQVRQDATVTPILIVWGPGSPDLPAGYRLTSDDVYVLDGNHPQLWSHLFNAPLLSSERRDSISAAVTQFQQLQTDHAADRTDSLRRLCWNSLRSGFHESRSENADRKERHRTLQRRHGVPTSANTAP